MPEIYAGDVIEIAIDHKELGGIIVEQKATEDGNFVEGGYQNADDDANITSPGNRIYVKNRIPWLFETTIGASAGVHSYITKLHASKIEATLTVSFNGGKIRSGRGLPFGDTTQNDQAGTMPLKMSGSGTFSEI